jgi:hypothetical protein
MPNVPRWLVQRGLPLAIVLLGIICVAAVTNGWWLTYEVLLGITSPKSTKNLPLSLAVSLLGWLIAPAVAGGVAGYVIQRQIMGPHRPNLVAAIRKLTDDG